MEPLKFSDRELQEVLGLFEAGGGLDQGAAAAALAGPGAGAGPPGAPAAAPGWAGPGGGPGPEMLGGTYIKPEPFIGGGGGGGDAAAAYPGGAQYIAQLRSMPQASAMGGPGGLPHAIPQQLLPPQYGTAPGARGVGKKKGGGAYVSHSAAEKQRRDRINSLIDELRGIVPPQGGGQDNSKRPKHAVLSDTIVLLKRLLSEPNNQAALTEWQNGEANGAASPDPSSDLEDGDAKVAISAVPGDGNIHKVKVVCLDQYGEWIPWRMRHAASRGACGGLTPGGSRAAAHPDRGPEVPGPVDSDGLHQYVPGGHRHRRLHGRQQ